MSENYSDQFQHNGIINLEKAIEEFQLFPWDKEIDDFKRSSNNPTIPKIIFESDDNRQLIIQATNSSSFNLKYSNLSSNKYSNFYISNNFDDKTLTVEEIIEYFFENKIENKIKLKTIINQDSNKVKGNSNKSPKNIFFYFKHSLSPLHSFNLLFILGLNALGIYASIKGPNQFPMWWNLLFIFSWPVLLFVHISYFFKNNKAFVTIDTRNHDLTYQMENEIIKFNRDEIFRCQITTCRTGRMSLCDEYSYAWFILKDGKYIIITNFIADPYKIVQTLNCKFEEKQLLAPLLPIF